MVDEQGTFAASGMNGMSLFEHLIKQRRQSQANQHIPSAHLDVETSALQKNLLAPQPHDVTACSIIASAGGAGASQCMPRRKLDAAGGISAYCGSANDVKTIKELTAAQALAESIAHAQRLAAAAGAAKKADSEAEAEKKRAAREAKVKEKGEAMVREAPDALFRLHEKGRGTLTVVQCRAIAHVHFDGAVLKGPKASDVKEQLAALLESKPTLVGDKVELRKGLCFELLFADSGEEKFKGTIEGVNTDGDGPVYACLYDNGDTIDHTEEELRIALRKE